METLLVCLLVGYGVWLAAYLCWEKHQAGKNPQSDATPAAPPQERPDIVGKSTFQIRPRTPDTAIPTPQAATKPENEKPMENAATFAPETEKRTSARIPDEKLDEAFEHLEIPDVPLEYEEEETWDEEEEMPLAAGRQRYASGASFEEIASAVKTAGDSSATDTERRQAGQVFGQLGGTEFFERLSNGSAAIGAKISGLMDYYLSPPAVAVAPLPDMPDEAVGFDIRDFV